MKEKIYCCYCEYFKNYTVGEVCINRHNDAGKELISLCSYKEPEQFRLKYKRIPEEINKNNDCKWHKDRGDSGDY